MGISYLTQSTTTGHAGTTSVTPTLPTGTANGTDRVFVSIASAPPTSVVTTPAGWTKVAEAELGGGTYGAGNGPRRVTVFYRDKDSSWTAVPSFPVPSGNVSRGVAWTVRKLAGDVWDTPVACWGSQSAATIGTTTFRVTSEQPMTVKPGGLVFPSTVRPESSTSSNPSASATGGITQISPVEIADGGVTTGNDISLTVGRATVGVGGAGYFTRESTVSAASDAGGTLWVHQWAGVADTTLPTAPTSPAATPAAGKVTVTWTASTDASGIAGYRVYRGGVQVGSVLGNGTSYVDTTVAASTAYSYTVRALDTFGNLSNASAAAPVTTGAWVFPDLVIHPSSPPTVSATAASITTAAFTPPAGALLVSCSTFDTTNVRSEVTTTITGDTSAWTDHVEQASGNGALGMESATALSSVSTTIQTAYPPATSNPMNLSVEVFENAQVVQAGKAAATATQTFTITRTSPNSRVIFTYAAANSTAAPTVPAGLEVLHLITTGYCGGAWITPALAAGDNVFTFTGVSAGAAMGWVEVAPLPTEGPPPGQQLTRQLTDSAAITDSASWVLTPGAPNPKAATFVEPFDGTTLPARWSRLYGTAGTFADGKAYLDTAGAYHYIHALGDVLDLTGSTYTIDVESAGAGVGTDVTFGLTTAGDVEANRMRWTISTWGNGSNWWLESWHAGTLVKSDSLPAARRYLRWREAAGTLYWEHSTDGQTWSPWHSHTPTLSLTALVPFSYWGRWDLTATGVDTTHVIRGINEPITPPTPTWDLTDPRIKEIALQLASTAENSVKEWWTKFGYIEDIDDDRGLTAGIVGWTSATGDMRVLVDRYSTAYPGNPLQPYLDELQTLATEGMGANAGTRAAQLLGQPFIDAWVAEANLQRFQLQQTGERDRVYWDPAYAQALADGVGPLGLAILYDISINHGPGSDWQSFGGIVADAAAVAPPPSQGGNEAAYLTALNDKRRAALAAWGDDQPNGRDEMHAALIASGNLGLVAPFTWSIYGDTFEITTWPEPWAYVPPITRTLTDAAAITDTHSRVLTAQRTHTDPAAIVDSASTALAAQRSHTDAAAISDSATTQLAASRTLTDSAAISDSATTRLDMPRQLTDSAAIVDSATTTLVAVRPLEDSAAITDSATWVLTRVETRTLTDSAAITDSATTQLAASRALADDAALTDSVVTKLDAVRQLVDAAGITDSATWTLTQVTTRTLVDSAAIVDSLSAVLTAARQLEDSAAITDAATTALQAIRQLSDDAAIVDSATTVLAAQRTLTDDAAITDSATTQLSASRALADDAAITDSASTALAASRQLESSAAITDSATWRIDRRVTLVDNAGITDSASTQLDARRQLESSAAITDVVQVNLASAGNRTLEDNAAIVDSATTRLEAQRQLTDSADITDSATAVVDRRAQLSDSAAITDSATWRIDRHVTLVDSAGITDSASTVADIRRTLTDSASITDSVTAEITVGAVQHTRQLEDSAAITDAAIHWWDREATLVDSAAITDSATWRIDRHVTLVDSAGITDSATADLKVGGVTLEDSAAITDSASWRIDRHVTLVDNVAITDSATTARHIRVTLVDSAGITDVAHAVTTVGRNIIVQWGRPDARQLSGEVSGRKTTATGVGYRTLTGTRVFRVGQISRGNYGGT